MLTYFGILPTRGLADKIGTKKTCPMVPEKVAAQTINYVKI